MRTFVIHILCLLLLVPAILKADVGETHDLNIQRKALMDNVERVKSRGGDQDSLLLLQSEIIHVDELLLASVNETMERERAFASKDRKLLKGHRIMSGFFIGLFLISLAILLITHKRMRMEEKPVNFYGRLLTDARNFFLHPLRLTKNGRQDMSGVLVLFSLLAMVLSLILQLLWVL